MRDGLKSYLNKYDNIGVRMSQAHKSRRTFSEKDSESQKDLFVDASGSNLLNKSKKKNMVNGSDYDTSNDHSTTKKVKLLSDIDQIEEEDLCDSCDECNDLDKTITKEQKIKSHMMHSH